MTTLADLLTPDQVVAVKQAAAAMMLGHEVESTPEPIGLGPLDLTALDLDPKSEAMVEVQCGCGAKMLVDPAPVPDEVRHLPRLMACRDCAREYLRDKTGHVVRTPRTAKMPWRTSVTDQEIAAHDAKILDTADHELQEALMLLDLTQVSDAELGRTVREAHQARVAERVREAKPAVDLANRLSDHADTAEMREQRQTIAAMRLKGFRVDKSLTIPPLEVVEATNLDELAPSIVRARYNQARHRLLGEPALDPDSATWQALIGEHDRLSDVARERSGRKPAKGTTQVAAPVAVTVEPDATLQAKAEGMAKVMGWTVERAAEFLAR